jgi:tetratricopeptide (TPR) repeat protein
VSDTTTTSNTNRSAVRARPLLVLLSALAACATARRPTEITYPPDVVTVTPLDRELAGKNDAELLAIGTAAAAAGDTARAANAFDRLAALHPRSPHAAEALLGAARAHAQRGEWGDALERYQAVLDRHAGAPQAHDAAFGVAEARYHVGDRPGARAALDAILARSGVAPADRVRALAERGVVELDEGRRDVAERTLRDAVATADAASATERIEPYYPAQAEYYLGDVFRAAFASVPVDPSRDGEDALRAALERKSELLLSAQDHYLKAVRLGDRTWAVAAGARIGDLYDTLRTQLLDAPLPAGLAPAHADAYRAELRAQVRVLATKALTAYEETISIASRAGVRDAASLDDAQASLARLRAAVETDAR